MLEFYRLKYIFVGKIHVLTWVTLGVVYLQNMTDNFDVSIF